MTEACEIWNTFNFMAEMGENIIKLLSEEIMHSFNPYAQKAYRIINE